MYGVAPHSPLINKEGIMMNMDKIVFDTYCVDIIYDGYTVSFMDDVVEGVVFDIWFDIEGSQSQYRCIPNEIRVEGNETPEISIYELNKLVENLEKAKMIIQETVELMFNKKERIVKKVNKDDNQENKE